MRPRFSLRWLFLAMALVAALCYWLVYPTVVANRFVRALAAKDYKLADTYFRNPADRNLFDWNDKHWHFHANAELEPQTFSQLLHGQRIISLTVMRGDATVHTDICTVIVTRAGLLTPMVTGGVGGGGIAYTN